jgi:AcrR family transcriptional regulator
MATASEPGDVPRGTSLREEHKNLTRRRLVDAAVELIEERGYAATTVDDIVTAAGAGRATFYLHFHSKADVVDAIVDLSRPDVAEYYADLDEVLAGGDPAAFAAWIDRALRWFEDHHALVLALQSILLTGGAEARDATFDFTVFMPRYLARWPRERHDEARLRIWMLIQLMSRVHLARRNGNELPAGADRALVVAVLRDIWAAGLHVDRT